MQAALTEASVANGLVESLREELERLRGESVALRELVQRHRRAASTAEVMAASEADGRLQEAIAAEAARYKREVALLREAAQAIYRQLAHVVCNRCCIKAPAHRAHDPR